MQVAVAEIPTAFTVFTHKLYDCPGVRPGIDSGDVAELIGRYVVPSNVYW
jgi:hypothetical protein